MEKTNLKPIVDDYAKMICGYFKEYGFIDCEESTFLWYFGETKHREGTHAPDKIKWLKNSKSAFGLFCEKLCYFAGANLVDWELVQNAFEIPGKSEIIQLKIALLDARRIRYARLDLVIINKIFEFVEIKRIKQEQTEISG